MEEIARYIDGTLQDRDVHTRDVRFDRIPESGRNIVGGMAFDFDVLVNGRHARITVAVTERPA